MPTVWDNLNALSINASHQPLRDAFLESFNKGIAAVIAVIGSHSNIPTFAFPSVDRPVGLPVFGNVGAADFLLSVCWGVGLSPRPTDMMTTSHGTIPASLRFVVDPLSAWATSRVQVTQLQDAATRIPLDDILPPLTAGSLHRESIVADLIRKLNQEFPEIIVQSHPHSLRQWVSLSLPDQVSFTQIADAVAASLAAHWTWTDQWVFLGPPGCCGGCGSEDMERCGSYARS